MNEEKLIKVLKQLTTLGNLQDEKNDSIDSRLNNLQKQINVLAWRLEHENLTKSARIT